MQHPPLIPAQAGIQSLLLLGPRWSLCSGQPKAGPEYGDERSGVRAWLNPLLAAHAGDAPFRRAVGGRGVSCCL